MPEEKKHGGNGVMEKVSDYFDGMKEGMKIVGMEPPDEKTGLMKCGCGGRAIIIARDPTKGDAWAVLCETCFVGTPYIDKEDAKKVWNRSRGWRAKENGEV